MSSLASIAAASAAAMLVVAALPGLASAANTCINSSANLTDNDCAAMQAWGDYPDWRDPITAICPQFRADPCSCVFDRPILCQNGRVKQVRIGKTFDGLRFPTVLLNLSAMYWFDVAGNNLTGSIPPALAELTQLEFLALGTNKFTGTVPSSLASLPLLYDFGIDNNPLLSGPLPAFEFPSLYSCCAAYNVPFDCPLPPNASNCSSCNYHAVPAPTCVNRSAGVATAKANSARGGGATGNRHRPVVVDAAGASRVHSRGRP